MKIMFYGNMSVKIVESQLITKLNDLIEKMRNLDLKISPKQQDVFEDADCCYMCEGIFTKNKPR